MAHYDVLNGRVCEIASESVQDLGSQEPTYVKAACEICEKLLSVLSASLDAEISLELGHVSDIVFSTNCEHHRQMFLEALNIESESTQIKTIKVFRYAGFGDMGIEGYSGQDVCCKSSIGWMLLGEDSSTGPQPGPKDSGILVDPAWIDLNTIRRWKQQCDQEHQKSCSQINSLSLTKSMRPTLLIDCWRQCLVTAPATASYLALSYVWGNVPSFMTRMANVDQLQNEFALSSPSLEPPIPLSILHAIHLTSILNERYLWVDSLCIVQDDTRTKHSELLNMSGIYANATLTIVLKGANAGQGIRGLPDLPEPRNHRQRVIKLAGSVACLHSTSGRLTERRSTWDERGWTFQESLFAKRKIFFHNDIVYWQCLSHRWHEDIVSGSEEQFPFVGIQEAYNLFQTIFPAIDQLYTQIQYYNDRELTYPEDAHNAFLGFLSALGDNFKGGFLSGIPVVNFDVGLLWRPSTDSKFRNNRTNGNRTMPSWSWLAWKGRLAPWVWNSADDCVKLNSSIQTANSWMRTLPLVKWSWHSSRDSRGTEIYSDWYLYRQKYLNGNEIPPRGWTRHDFEPASGEENSFPEAPHRPSCFYKHDSSTQSEFWYPVPLVESPEDRTTPRFAPFTSCQTRRAILFGLHDYDRSLCMTSVRNRAGKWVGCLYLHGYPPIDGSINEFVGDMGSEKPAEKSFELVEISMGYVYDSEREGLGFDELNHPERPRRGEKYEFYNVLSIVWKDGVAYRTGLGRVEKVAWETEDRSWVDLILG